MPRPSNQDIYNREAHTEAGAEQAASTAQALYPDAKMIEAEVKKDDIGAIIGYEVTMGWLEGEATYHILEVQLRPDYSVSGTEERPNVPPGAAHKPDKHEKPLKERKADHPKGKSGR